MQLSTTKYGFRIKTKNGAIVDNLSFAGKDEPDAERKLRQIYLGCEILEAKLLAIQPHRGGAMSFEDVVDLISDQAPRNTTE